MNTTPFEQLHNVWLGSVNLQSSDLAFEKAIKDSRHLLDLEDDWDGEGSPAYTEATWKRATDFLRANANKLRSLLDRQTPVPDISPGPYGSIDLHWQTQTRELLVSIPVEPEQPAGYYGDDHGKNRIKGTLDTAGRNEWLLMWLME